MTASRAAVLRALPGEGFLPPGATAAFLRGPARSADDVQAFADRFWTLAPGERVRTWDTLAAAVTGPAAARLAELRPGIGVKVVTPADPDAAELAGLVRQLFVLPAATRAVRRFEWLAARTGSLARWSAAARALAATDPDLARLDPRLVWWLSNGAEPERIDQEVWVAVRDRHRLRLRWWARMAKVRNLLITGVVVGLAGYSAYCKPAATRNYQRPHLILPRFSQVEVDAMLEYERGNRIGPPPARWREWVTAGRPGTRYTP